MDDAALQDRFDAATKLMAEAAAHARSYFDRLETLTVRNKGVQDVVSEADLDTEVLIRDRLMTRFPEDDFLGEETGRGTLKGGRGIWVVDPIDGTQPFVSGMTSWCVSIAFVLDGVPTMGFVTAPAREEIFVGRRGHGATLNGRPIRVSTSESIAQGLLGIGHSPRVPAADFLPMFGRFIEEGAMFYRDGSGALSLCYVACGRLIGYVERQINSWDCLAAVAIIEAAGGRVNDVLAGDGMWSGNSIVAGPPALYPALAAALAGTPD